MDHKDSDIEILTKEITICKNTILLWGIYKPSNLSEIDFTSSLKTIVSKLSYEYEKLILMGDFNMTWYLDTFALLPSNINPTCFKNSKNPSCIVFETGISDHHKMISTIIKFHFARESPKTKYYKD